MAPLVTMFFGLPFSSWAPFYPQTQLVCYLFPFLFHSVRRHAQQNVIQVCIRQTALALRIIHGRRSTVGRHSIIFFFSTEMSLVISKFRD